MNAIVTGGAGFLGSHLCDELLKRGYKVICVDNLLTGSLGNIKHLENNPNFQFINHDASKPLPENLKADYVYHMSSPASPNKDNPVSYQNLPFETMAANTRGTWNLCEFALKNNAKLLFASTSEVYGDPLEHPQKESYRGNVSSTGPRSVYDEAKRFGETIVSAFVRSKGLDGRIIRIFNTYGPGMTADGRVVIEFVKAALENRPLTVFGDGSQTRSFCYVSDLIKGVISAMEKGQAGEIYNLGNPNEFTILELAGIVKKLTGATSEFAFSELPQDDPAKRCPDITKAKQSLGWEPRVQLEEGLKKLIDYLKISDKI